MSIVAAPPTELLARSHLDWGDGLVPAIVLASALPMLLVEVLRPGRTFPRVAGWWTRALFLNLVQVAGVLVAGLLWNDWMHARRPWSADRLGVLGGAALGYFVHTFVYYWWHRWRHEVDFLWRWMHQLHHSPQRLELLTSFYKHPLEILANGLLSSATLYLVVGVGPEAASGAMLLNGVAELFYHWNRRTPAWLGYLIQRPESHLVHHEEGVHGYNFGDLPLWDILFGTFRNPATWDARCGFGPHAEHRFADMLLGEDVSAGPKT